MVSRQPAFKSLADARKRVLPNGQNLSGTGEASELRPFLSFLLHAFNRIDSIPGCIATMPATRTGRQSSPAKTDDSPSKTRVQPMRGARLRSASPFLDTSSASTSAAASQASQPSQSSSPAKFTRASPRKKADTAAASLQLPTRRSTRSRSRSVDPDSLPSIDEDSSLAPTSEAAEASESDVEVAQSSTIRSDTTGTVQDDDSESPEPRLEPIAEEATLSATHNAGPEADDDGESGASSSSSSSSDSSDSESDSNDSGSESSSSAEETEDDAAADLSALLKASQQAYKSRAPVASTTQSRFEDNQDVITLDAITEGASTSKKAGKAMPLVVKAKHQMAKSQSQPSRKDSKDKLDKQIEALDQGSLPTDTKKRSKHARTVQTSAGSSWFDMPEFGASASRLAALKKQSAADSGHSKATGRDARLASAEQLRREVQALRLRNALDPKRFYRGSAKNQAMPKFAQMGKIIASPLEPKAVMSKQERGRTVVEELIRDAEAASYAKRKFSESQASHRSNYNGRRKPPSKKRRT